ncbi:hypothetical protein, partial [Paenibacillus hemerocallicola]|uniref:hypothetical protein n=1 Tax=Paenibacillus hemerocallicola TaxID=1172614 RepID=UPI001C406C6D
SIQHSAFSIQHPAFSIQHSTFTYSVLLFSRLLDQRHLDRALLRGSFSERLHQPRFRLFAAIFPYNGTKAGELL